METGANGAMVALVAGVLFGAVWCSWSAEPGSRAQPGQVRTWTDATGQHRTEAALVSYDPTAKSVRLRKRDGSEITVALDKLSAADAEFLRTGRETSAPAAVPAATQAGSLAEVPLPPDVRDVSREASTRRVPVNMAGMESNGGPDFVPGLGDVDYSPRPLPRPVLKGVWTPNAQRDMHAELVAFYRQRLRPPEWQESSGTIKYLRDMETKEIPWTRFQQAGAARAVRVLIRGSAIEVVEYLPARPKSSAALATPAAPAARQRPRPGGKGL